MQVQVKFTTFGSCTAIGGFAPGDIARVSPDMAKHLVEEARCAKYVEQPKPQASAPIAEEPQPRKRKGR